jgi:hypothetical protein
MKLRPHLNFFTVGPVAAKRPLFTFLLHLLVLLFISTLCAAVASLVLALGILHPDLETLLPLVESYIVV